MSWPHKHSYSYKVFSMTHPEKSRYKCKECNVSCTSAQQLMQHVKGIKHRERVEIKAQHRSQRRKLREGREIVDERTRDERKKGIMQTSESPEQHQQNEQIMETAMTMKTKVLNASSEECSASSSQMVDVTNEEENDNEESEDVFGQELHCTKDCAKNADENQQKTPVLNPVTCNTDVFHFLKNFEVKDQSDVAFALKIAQMFSKAVNTYKEYKLEEMLCTGEEDDDIVVKEEHHISTNTHDITVDSDAAASKQSSLVLHSLAYDGAELDKINTEAKECEDGSNSKQTGYSISQAIGNREVRELCSKNSSPEKSISCTCSSSKTLSICVSHSNVASSSSPTNEVRSSTETSITNSTDDGIYRSGTDMWMEDECCLAAEAACSDDDDDNDA